MATLDVADLAEAIKAALETPNTPATRLDVFVSDPTPVKDSDGRAHPFAVIHPGPGRLHAQALSDRQEHLDWPVQITCAGGDTTRALRAVTRVRDRLTGVTLTVAGRPVRLIEDPTYVAPPVTVDRDVTPNEWFTPLLFRTLTPTTPTA